MGRHFARSGASPGTAGTSHIAGLDGIRGLAVVAVVAFHLGFGWARGGYLGVDSFLVLSGYLITAGLLAEHQRSGGIRLRAFWGRRARRLLPALLVVLVASALYAAFVALPDEGRALRFDALSALGFVSNWRFVFSSQGYFGQTSAPSLLRHTWSLGVEAQLYLLWPVVVVVGLRRRGPGAVAAVAGGLGAASAGLAMLLAPTHGDVSRAYYGTDTRAAAFLFGAALAGMLAGRSGLRRGATRVALATTTAGGAAATLFLWATLNGTSRWLFRGGLLAAALATVALVAEVVCAPRGRIARALSAGPLRLLGRVSYGIYLWHWPLILVLDHRRTGLSGPGLLAVRLGATAAATTVSWLAVERPVMGLGPRRVPRRWQPAAGVLVGATLVAGVLLPASAGAARPGSHLAAAGPAPIVAGDPEPTTAAPAPLVQAVMLGDSVAVTVGNAIKPFGPDYRFAFGNDAIVGCGVAVGSALKTLGEVAQVPGRCTGWEQAWQQTIDSAHPDVALILLGRWEVLDRLIDGSWRHIGEPAFDAYLAGRLDRALAIATSGGAIAVLCTAPYYQGQERPQGGTWPENDPARVDRFNELAREAVARHPAAVLYDLNGAVSPNAKFASILDGVAVRSSDGVHFTPASGAFLSPRLFPVLRVAAARDPGIAAGAH